MTSRTLTYMALLAVLVTTGCYNSEKDYQRLLEEKESLVQELTTARQDKIILTQALGNITREQENLQTLLNISHSLVPGASRTAGAVALPPLRVLGSSPVVGVEEDDYWIQSSTAASAAGVPPNAPQGSGLVGRANSSKIHLTQPGDVLSSIAMKYNTTVERLLELNPQLKSRRDYMIWANEEIKVP